MSTEKSDDKSREIAHWERAVRERFRNVCCNCGGSTKLKVRQVIPETMGGSYNSDNAILICRPCELFLDVPNKGDSKTKRSINFWISQEMHKRITNGLSDKNGFESVGSMVRYLMSRFITEPERFDDLDQYQDARSADVKLNVWVDQDRYETFKSIAEKQGKTVTQLLKGLIRMFELESEVLNKNQVGK